MLTNSNTLPLDGLSPAIDAQDDLYKAAEAVVDAALTCHEAKYDIKVGRFLRDKLVRQVYDDPLKTAKVLDPDTFSGPKPSI